MNSRKLAGASAASVGAVSAVAALLLGTLSGTADERSSASAFGLAAYGLIDIDPTPYVEAPPDDSKALLELPGENRDGLSIAVLKVEAEHFRSRATALKVDVLGLRLKVLEATCDNGRGDSTIISTDGDGSSSPYAGQTLDLSPVVRVEFNRQHRDGDRLTVDAAVVSLLPADKAALAIAEKDLELLKEVAPAGMKLPQSLSEVKSADSPKAAEDGQAGVDAPKAAEEGQAAEDGQDGESGESSGPVTAGDLLKSIQDLNPNLATPKADDALLEIVISSASCEEEQRKDDRKEEAPRPEPVEADLPVTH